MAPIFEFTSTRYVSLFFSPRLSIFSHTSFFTVLPNDLTAHTIPIAPSYTNTT
jgi:hypothetical protein